MELSKWTEAIIKMAAGFPALPDDPTCEGLPALCIAMGWPHETARQELRGVSAKLGFERAMQVMQYCEQAGGENCDALRQLIEKSPTAKRTVQPSLTDLLASASKEHAEVFMAYAEAMRDGTFSPNDKRRMLREALEAAAAALALVDGIERENVVPMRVAS